MVSGGLLGAAVPLGAAVTPTVAEAIGTTAGDDEAAVWDVAAGPQPANANSATTTIRLRTRAGYEPPCYGTMTRVRPSR